MEEEKDAQTKPRCRTAKINEFTTTKALRDRPLEVEDQLLRLSAWAGCTDEQIAASLGVPVEQLRRDYGPELARECLVGEAKIKRQIFVTAVQQRDASLLRLLAANRCGWAGDPQIRELNALRIEEKRAQLKAGRLAAEHSKIDLERKKVERWIIRIGARQA